MMEGKRIQLSIAGLLVFAVLLIKELIRPEDSYSWHITGLILYSGGLLVMIFYFLFAVRTGRGEGGD